MAKLENFKDWSGNGRNKISLWFKNVILGSSDHRMGRKRRESDATFWLEVAGGIGGLVGEEVEERRIISGKEVWQGMEVDEELKEEVTCSLDCNLANKKVCSSKITSRDINMLP